MDHWQQVYADSGVIILEDSASSVNAREVADVLRLNGATHITVLNNEAIIATLSNFDLASIRRLPHVRYVARDSAVPPDIKATARGHAHAAIAFYEADHRRLPLGHCQVL